MHSKNKIFDRGIVSIVALVFFWVQPFNLKAGDSEEKAEKQVTFYSTYGYIRDDSWHIPLRIRIVEKASLISRALGKGAREVLHQEANIEDLSDDQKAIYSSRAEGFLADNESRETTKFIFDGDPEQQVFQVRKNGKVVRSDRNGNIEGTIILSQTKASSLISAQQSTDGWLRFRSVTKDQAGIGLVKLIAEHGISVVSDIDDTIKVTEIPLGKPVVLKHTFFAPFIAAPGMAEMYLEFPPSAAFHYISGGPWQLYSPLTDFLFSKEAGFPRGSVHMKNVRTNPFESESYHDIGKLINDGSQQVTYTQKVNQISELMRHFPKRQFILIGDSGEKDPEVYSEIKRLFPSQVKEIRIRDLVNAQHCKPERLAQMTVVKVAEAESFKCDFDAGENQENQSGS